MAALRFITAIEKNKISLMDASPEFIKKIEKTATSLGDIHVLSHTDIELLALTLELKEKGHIVRLATDDYSMQNVANKAGLEHMSLITIGICKQLKWIRYCPGCYRRYPSNFKDDTCQICGTLLKRKPQKQKKIIPRKKDA